MKAIAVACVTVLTHSAAYAGYTATTNVDSVKIQGNTDNDQPIEPGGVEGVVITSNGNDTSDTGVGGSYAYIQVLSEDRTQGGASDYGYVNIGADEINLSGTTRVNGTLTTSSNVSVGGNLDMTNGAISNVTTLSASGQISSGSVSTGAITATSLNAGSGTIQTTGTVSGGTGTFTTLNSGSISNTGTVSTSMLSVVNGSTFSGPIDAQGAISNSSANYGGAVYVNDALTVTGATTTAGIANTGSFDQTGTANINTSGSANTNIGTGTNTGTVTIGNSSNTVSIAGGTNNITGTTNINASANNDTNINTGTSTGSVTIGNANAGNITLQSGASSTLVVGDSGTAITGTLSSTGNSTLGTASGTTNTFGSGANSTNTIGNAGTSSNTITGATNNITATTANNIAGTTNINTTSGSTTNIATSAAATTNIGMLGGTNNLAGTTNINDSVDSATNINTGTSTGAVTIGNALNSTSLNSATNNIGVSSGYATANNIGTNNSFASTNTIGNSNAGSTVTAYGGNSSLAIANNSAVLMTDGAGNAGGMVATDAASATIRASTAGALATNGTAGTMTINNGGGYTAYNTSQAVGNNTTIANLLNGAQYTNQINGNLLVDGNVYINGTLNYVSSDAANTSVVGGGSVLAGATQQIAGGSAIVLKDTDAPHTVVDANGRLTNVAGAAAESSASLTLTNGYGETHGIIVTERQTTISGGTRSSSLTLDDNGATFSNSANGRPVQVHGVADGTGDFDAVNVRQFAGAVASIAAMANIPEVAPGKTLAVGAGYGNYMSKDALAIGASYRLTENSVLKASLATGTGDGRKTTYGVGAAFSW